MIKSFDIIMLYKIALFAILGVAVITAGLNYD